MCRSCRLDLDLELALGFGVADSRVFGNCLYLIPEPAFLLKRVRRYGDF